MAKINYPHLLNDEGEPIALPFKFAICSTCEGHGRSSAYLGAFTRDDLDQQGPDWCEDYFAGNFDRSCDDCEGTGKVKVADRARMKPEQVKAYDEHLSDEAAYEAEARAERRGLGLDY